MGHPGIMNSATSIALCLLLGAAEAGFIQNGLYFMPTVYPKYEVGRMYSVAGAFAGLIAYGFLHIESNSMYGRQALFSFEGTSRSRCQSSPF